MSKYDEIELLDNASLAKLALADASAYDDIILQHVKPLSRRIAYAPPAPGGMDGSITELLSITSWRLMLDAIAGMTGDGTNLTSLVDLSGHSTTVAPIAPKSPLYGPTLWRGVQPAVQFVSAVGTNNARIQVGGDASWTTLFHPFTVVMVVDALSTDGARDANLYRDNAQTKTVGYLNQSVGKWSLYSGTVFDSAFTVAGRSGPNIRIDCNNGAASFICANGTKSLGDAGTSQDALGLFYIGSNAANNAPCNMVIPFFGVITHALTDDEWSAVVASLRIRYANIPAT